MASKDANPCCKLSSGAISDILRGNYVDKPLLQVLRSKKVCGGNEGDVYHLTISDGKHHSSCAKLPVQVSKRITGGVVDMYSVIRIEKYILTSTLNDGKAASWKVTIKDLSVLNSGAEVGGILGSPADFVNLTSTPISQPSTSTPISQPSKQAHLLSFGEPDNSGISSNQSQGNTTSAPRSTSLLYSAVRIHDICNLNPYNPSNPTIQARVAMKSAKRNWNKARGKGTFFKMDLVDKTGEIRATAFGNECEKFYDVIELNKFYQISRFRVKPAVKEYNNLRHDYEIAFDCETTVTLCPESVGSIPVISFNFSPLISLLDKPVNSSVDIIGVCKMCSNLQTVSCKKKKEWVREVILVDDSDTSAILTLWGNDAKTFDGGTNPVIAVKSALLKDYNGRRLSLTLNSVLQINPNIPEAHTLHSWFHSGGVNHDLRNISSYMIYGEPKQTTLMEAQDNKLGSEGKPCYVRVVATITSIIADEIIYKACMNTDCNKKVTEQRVGVWWCDKCEQEFRAFKNQLVLPVCLADGSGQQWVTAFHSVAELLLGESVTEVACALKSTNNKFAQILNNAIFKTYIFTLCYKVNAHTGDSKLEVTVVKAEPARSLEEFRTHVVDGLKKVTGKVSVCKDCPALTRMVVGRCVS